MIDEVAPAKRPRRGRIALLAAIGVAVAAAVGVVAWMTLGSSSFTVTGTITVSDSDSSGLTFAGHTGACQGKGGYGDLRAGTQVVITDASGTTIATGQIQGAGKPTTVGVTARVVKCVFTLEVANVPGGHDFYGVEVAHRGRVQYDADQIRKPLTLTIG